MECAACCGTYLLPTVSGKNSRTQCIGRMVLGQQAENKSLPRRLFEIPYSIKEHGKSIGIVFDYRFRRSLAGYQREFGQVSRGLKVGVCDINAKLRPHFAKGVKKLGIKLAAPIEDNSERRSQDLVRELAEAISRP